PGPHFLHHGVRHLADQSGADLYPILLFQVTLNVARAHAARVHRQNLLVEARKAAFVLGNNLGFEGPVAVARHFDLYRPEVPLYLLAAAAVSVVAASAPFWRVLLIAQMMAHLGFIARSISVLVSRLSKPSGPTISSVVF